MKQQCIPKFLKEEISKYVCVLIKNRYLGSWYEATPYMTKIITMYNNIPKKNIVKSYTANDACLHDYFPRPSEIFVRRWARENIDTFYNDAVAKIYMDKYYPEGME